jgi:hypothetical protein
MSGTRHGNRIVGPAGVAVGVVLLLAGCGSGGSRSDAAATTAAATAPSGGADFCSQAAAIDDRVNAAVSKLPGDASIADSFRQLTTELRAIQAPAPIAADWETMAGGLQRMGDAISNIDITDPATLKALDDASSALSSASDRVDTYLHDQCGINN